MTADISSVEEAYEAIAADLISFPNGRPWESATAHYQLLPGMVGVTWTLSSNGVADDRWAGGDDSHGRLARKAALYLKNEILSKTGDVIWGFDFILYADGKFKLKYDYTKPDAYEESSETIDLEDAVNRLVDLGVDVDISYMPRQPDTKN